MSGETVWALGLLTGLSMTLIGALVSVIFVLLGRVEKRLDKIEEVLIRLDGRLRALEPQTAA